MPLWTSDAGLLLMVWLVTVLFLSQRLRLVLHALFPFSFLLLLLLMVMVAVLFDVAPLVFLSCFPTRLVECHQIVIAMHVSQREQQHHLQLHQCPLVLHHLVLLQRQQRMIEMKPMLLLLLQPLVLFALALFAQLPLSSQRIVSSSAPMQLTCSTLMSQREQYQWAEKVTWPV